MKRRIPFTVAVLLAIPAMAGERSFTFTSIDYPDAKHTIAIGINAGGEIVGRYFDSSNVQHGFIYGKGVYTSVDYPGALLTQLRGIGPGGDIVGTYRMPGEPGVNNHGFLLTPAGAFLPVNYPGHTSFIAQRILPDGTIVGCYHDTNTTSTMRGATILSTGAYSEITAYASMHNGATPDASRIVGLFHDMSTHTYRSYLIDNGVFTAFDAPNSTYTDAWDISPTGAIVGSFDDLAHDTHGYLLERGQWTVLDAPNSIATLAYGINAGGDIVGTYLDANGYWHGFVASRH